MTLRPAVLSLVWMAALFQAMLATPTSASPQLGPGAVGEPPVSTADRAGAVRLIGAALQNVAALNRPDKVGYATVWDGNKYVQCANSLRHGWRCEAAGSLMQPSLERVLTPERKARLGTLGWRADPAFGNYVQLFSAQTPLNEIAEHVLGTLVDVYGAGPGDVEVQTWWVRDEDCPPRNGYSQNLAGIVNDAPGMAATAVHACAFEPTRGVESDGAAETAAALVSRYGAKVAAEIERLRLNHDRAVFVVFDAGIGYVQCQPEPPAAIYCEAQSADSWPALADVLTPERIAQLHAVGFADPGRAPNYSKTYPAQFGDDIIATELLTLLHDVYGYNGVATLAVKTEDGP